MGGQRQRLSLVFLTVLANSALWAGEPAKRDGHDDPLPEGTLARLGTKRLRHESSICALAFSGDSSVLATSGLDEAVRVWLVSSGKKLLELKVRDYKFNSLRSVVV